MTGGPFKKDQFKNWRITAGSKQIELEKYSNKPSF
jgi:hypothetical protein